MIWPLRRRKALTPEQRVLTSRIEEIDKRLTEIGRVLRYEKAGTFKRQELEIERNHLTAIGRSTRLRLDGLRSPPAPTAPEDENAASRERFILWQMAQRREHREAFIRKLEASGEHEQARRHRLALLDLRAEVEREMFG